MSELYPGKNFPLVEVNEVWQGGFGNIRKECRVKINGENWSQYITDFSLEIVDRTVPLVTITFYARLPEDDAND